MSVITARPGAASLMARIAWLAMLSGDQATAQSSVRSSSAV
jgi:hypothetical protein